MGLVYKICPRCFKGRQYDQACETPSCKELQASPTYHRDELEGQLHIAKEMLKEGNTEADWASEVKDLEKQLMAYDAHVGAAAFTQ